MSRASGRAAPAPAFAAAVAAVAVAVAAASLAAGASAGPPDPQSEAGLPSKTLENSIPYVWGGGAPAEWAVGPGGAGIKVAVIDTGVDTFHPDFAGKDGVSRIVASRNLLGAGPAFDADGHGTGVAGVIAAGGALRGMAPLSEIASYKVSGDGLSVSPDVIMLAVREAVADGADVVNISLGVNRTNEDIDAEVNRAVAGGVVVVAAAGNDGPDPGSIGSPGRNPNVITVGATYNNVTAGLVATIEYGGSTYGAVPMVGAPEPQGPVEGRIVFAGHATESDIERAGSAVAGAIVLAERGSADPDTLVYFSDKERNAAAGGAAAIVVYNNEPGMFFGELVHEHNPDGYAPSIPAASLSREDGLELREAAGLKGGAAPAVLEVMESPDFVVGFSSRGPVSPFYPKPDLVAPGVFVNTTLNGGGYNVSSGTSFAAPHVAGAAALLLERHSGLSPAAVRSILVTTADEVAGAEGSPNVGRGLPDAAGAGRLNATRALAAGIVFEPPLLDLDASPTRPSGSASIGVARIDGGPVGPLDVSASLPRGVSGHHSVEYGPGNGATVTLRASLGGGAEGGGEGEVDWGTRTLAGSLAVSDGEGSYTVPVMVRVSNGTVSAAEVPRGAGWLGLGSGGGEGGAIEVSVEAPGGWSYARVTVTDPLTGAQYHSSSRPGEPARIGVERGGTHWIEASILVGGRPGGPVADAFGKVDVAGASEAWAAGGGRGPDPAAGDGIPWPHLPERQAPIVAAAVATIAAAGAAIAVRSRRAQPMPRHPARSSGGGDGRA